MRVLANIASLLTTDAINRASTLAVYALVARRLGTFSFGQLSLALALFATFQAFAGAGLRLLITRDVARQRERAAAYVVNASMIALAASATSIVVLAVFAMLMGYSPETRRLILLLSTALVPFALASVAEGIFRAWERMHYIVWASVPVHVLKVALAALLLLGGGGILEIIVLLVLSHVALFAAEWAILVRYITRLRFNPSTDMALSLARSTAPFFGMETLFALIGSLNVVLLSKLATEREVALYTASIQIIVPSALVMQNAALSVFPMLCRHSSDAPANASLVAQRIWELLLAIIVPSIVGIMFLAEPALMLLYGNRDFLAASHTMRIVMFSLLATAGSSVLGHVLLANLRERINFRIVATDVVFNLAVGLVLIPRYQLWGAAVTFLLTRLFDFVQHYFWTARLLPNLRLVSLIWKPAAASLCMAAFLALVPHRNLLFTVLSAGTLYVLTWFALAFWSSGGAQALKARYLYGWSE